MTTNPINNSISDSYSKFYGPTVTLTSTGSGPKIKSKTQSALERYEADRAVREAQEQEKISKDPAYAYIKKINFMKGQSALNSLNQSINKEEQMKLNFSRQFGTGNQDYQKWRNWQEVSAGTPVGKFLMMQRSAQLDPNDPEKKEINQRLYGPNKQKPNNSFY